MEGFVWKVLCERFCVEGFVWRVLCERFCVEGFVWKRAVCRSLAGTEPVRIRCWPLFRLVAKV